MGTQAGPRFRPPPPTQSEPPCPLNHPPPRSKTEHTASFFAGNPSPQNSSILGKTSARKKYICPTGGVGGFKGDPKSLVVLYIHNIIYASIKFMVTKMTAMRFQVSTIYPSFGQFVVLLKILESSPSFVHLSFDLHNLIQVLKILIYH